MQKAFLDIVERLEERVSLPNMERMEERVGKRQTIGFGFGVRYAVEIVNQVAEEYKQKTIINGQYCWQTCACTESCNDCNRLSEGYIDWYENLDDWETEYKQEVCEWKQCGGNLRPYQTTSCEKFALYDISYVYCPYCGKRIFVKE